ncbi:MAG: hypothetical protein V1936_01950 [Patescibacteria group bacterium]
MRRYFILLAVALLLILVGVYIFYSGRDSLFRDDNFYESGDAPDAIQGGLF